MLGLIFILIGLLAAGFTIGKYHQQADWGNPLLNCFDGWNRLYCHYYHRLRGMPIQLPEQGAALVVANHISGLDPLLLISACSRPVRFFVARDQYEIPWVKPIFKAAGCIPVDMSAGGGAFRQALKALRQGEVVGIFPQGRVPDKGEGPPPLQAGVARLAKLAKSDIYAIYLQGIRGEHLIYGSLIPRSHAQLTCYAKSDAAEQDEQAVLGWLNEKLIPKHA